MAGCGPANEPAPAGVEPGPRIDALASAGRVSFASESYTCARSEAGVQCWGAGGSGQLGDGLIAPGRPLPVRVPLPSGVTAIAAGGGHACAIAASDLWCWGARGAVGVKTRRVVLPPQKLEGLPGSVQRVDAGGGHTCAVLARGLWCWGRNEAGQLGSESRERCQMHFTSVACRKLPAPVPGLPRPVGALGIGAAHSCAVAGDAVWCWGSNERGQLGDPAAPTGPKPRPVPGVPGGVSELAAGFAHSCALAAGEVFCWGANDLGQLGDGTATDRPQPVRVRGLPAADAIAAGRQHTCALAAGAVYCWGDDAEGQVGSGRHPALEAGRVKGLDGPATAISAGADVSCAALAAGGVVCWGDDDFGQLGRGRRSGDGRPLPVGPWDDGSIRDVDGDGSIVVACVGDSNTQAGLPGARGWCEELDDLLSDPAWSTVNRGIGGATATRTSVRSAEQLLDYAIANDGADVVITALGINDLIAGVDPQQVVAAHIELKLRALSHGVAFFVGLTPPARDADHRLNPDVAALNDRLRGVFPEAEWIDFGAGLSPGDYRDHIHLGRSGHARIGRRAFEALRRAGAPG